jgi:hypothetical protein
VNDISLAQTVASVVDAFERDDVVLDYLWTVMEATDDGADVDSVVDAVFDGDASRLAQARSLTEKAWREAGGSELSADLIAPTPDGRLVMFGPAREVVHELLD